MLTVTPVDHVYAIVVLIVVPVFTLITFPRTLAQIRAGGERALIGAYRRTILTWAFFGVCAMTIWYLSDRDWTALGLQWPQPMEFVVASLSAALIIVVVVLPVRGLSMSPDGQARLEAQLGDLKDFLPHTQRAERWFRLVALNAGLAEEIIFRGYLLWYLQMFMGILPAAILAALLFAFAHSYQGMRQLPAILFISAVAVGLYVYTESLLVPILFHFVLDALQGHYLAAARQTSLVTEEPGG